MVQGWMSYLSAEAGEEMVRRTGLQGEYSHIEPVTDGATRHCGKCGNEFTGLPGAKLAICELVLHVSQQRSSIGTDNASPIIRRFGWSKEG